MTTSEINKFMQEAIIEGRKAIPHCFPNPPVGCVIVKDHEIIARGHTNEPGKDHAEMMALKNLPQGIDSFSMFVTLEPCSFFGRTPSCAKEIVKTKVASIYVGIIDPHEKNNGQGIAILKASSIQVQVGILQEQITRELEPYLIKK